MIFYLIVLCGNWNLLYAIKKTSVSDIRCFSLPCATRNPHNENCRSTVDLFRCEFKKKKSSKIEKRKSWVNSDVKVGHATSILNPMGQNVPQTHLQVFSQFWMSQSYRPVDPHFIDRARRSRDGLMSPVRVIVVVQDPLPHRRPLLTVDSPEHVMRLGLYADVLIEGLVLVYFGWGLKRKRQSWSSFVEGVNGIKWTTIHSTV